MLATSICHFYWQVKVCVSGHLDKDDTLKDKET